MADFDLEQMKSMLQNLAESLASTKGDDRIVEKLKQVEKAIRETQKRIDEDSKKSKQEARKSALEYQKELINALEKADLFKTTREAITESIEKSGNQETLNTPGFDLGSGLKKGAAQYLSILGKVNGGMNKVADTLANANAKMNGSVANFVSALGVSEKSAAGILAKMVDENVSSFRSLINSAEGTIGSITDMRKAMSVAGMGAKEFADAIAQGGQGAKLLGGQNWAELYGSIKQQTKNMGMYGFTLEQMTKAQNEYLEILSGQGQVVRLGKDGEALTKGLDALLVSTSKTAVILGKTREEQLAAAAANARDPNFAIFRRSLGLTEEQQVILDDIMGSLNTVSPALKGVIQELTMYDGAFKSTEAAQTYAILPPETQRQIQNLVEQIKTGNIDATTGQKQIQALAESVQGMSKDQSAYLGRMGDYVGGAFQNVTTTIQGLDNVNRDKNLVDGTEIKDTATQELLKVEERIKRIQTMMNDSVTAVMVPMMEKLGPAMASAGDWFDGMQGKLSETIKYLGQFDTAITAIAGIIGGGAIIGNLGGFIAGLVTSAALPAITGFVNMITAPVKKLGGFAVDIAKSLASGTFLKSIAGAVAGAMGTTLKTLAGTITTAVKSGIGALTGASMGSPGSRKGGKVKGALGVAAGAGLAFGADAVAGLAGVGDTEIDQKQDDANWEKMNWWQTIESGIARGIENVGDYVAPNVANEARAARIADETAYLKEQEAESPKETLLEEKPKTEVEPVKTEVEEKPKTEVEPAGDNSYAKLTESFGQKINEMEAAVTTTDATQPSTVNKIETAEIQDVEEQTALQRADDPTTLALGDMKSILERIYVILRQMSDTNNNLGTFGATQTEQLIRLQQDMVRLTRNAQP